MAEITLPATYVDGTEGADQYALSTQSISLKLLQTIQLPQIHHGSTCHRRNAVPRLSTDSDRIGAMLESEGFGHTQTRPK